MNNTKTLSTIIRLKKKEYMYPRYCNALNPDITGRSSISTTNFKIEGWDVILFSIWYNYNL
jgi:hypothetical protein